MMMYRTLIPLIALVIAPALIAAPSFKLEPIGEARFPTGYLIDGVELGGLSGIDYDPKTRSFVAICDDRAEHGPARFYELKIALDDGRLDDGDVTITRTTEILDLDGSSFAAGEVDPESIRFAPVPDLLYWTSEGNADAGIAPSVRIMTRDGKPVDTFQIPDKYLPETDMGVRNNLALESLTLSSSNSFLITATENALVQDGPAAALSSGSPSRVLAFYRAFGSPAAEYIYQTDPVAEAPEPAGAFNMNGLAELLTVAPDTMVAVERSFSTGKGNVIKLYWVDRGDATNVLGLKSIKGKNIKPLRKTLLLNLAKLGTALDNIEGISFGPSLPSGERTLILVSDNNFNANGQFTQFLAFKIIE